MTAQTSFACDGCPATNWNNIRHWIKYIRNDKENGLEVTLEDLKRLERYINQFEWVADKGIKKAMEERDEHYKKWNSEWNSICNSDDNMPCSK